MLYFPTRSYSDPNVSVQSQIFKARSAKLKKYLLDLSVTSGKVLLSAVKQALETNNIVLTNPNDFLQLVQKCKHRVKVDSIMQSITFTSIDAKDKISATFVVPSSGNFPDESVASQSSTQKNYFLPQPPSRSRPVSSLQPRRHNTSQEKSVASTIDDFQSEKTEFSVYNEQLYIQAGITLEVKKHYRPRSAGPPKLTSNQRRSVSPSIDTNSEVNHQHINDIMLKRGWFKLLGKQKPSKATGLNQSMGPKAYSSAKLNDSTTEEIGNVNDTFSQIEAPSKRLQTEDNIRSQKQLTREIKNDEPQLVPNIIEYKRKPLTQGLGTYDEEVIELTHDLQKYQVEYEYIFRLLKSLMKLMEENNSEYVAREMFEKDTATLMPVIGETFYKRIIDISIDKQGRLSLDLMSSFMNYYKYAPYIVKHFKNSSHQFQQIAMFGSKIEGNIRQVHNNCNLLSQRIEEKFKKIGKAYRFFDLDKSGVVRLPEFKHGLDLLGLRLSEAETKDLFNYLDSKKHGYLDHDEFCDILEERRLMKGIKAKQDEIMKNTKHKGRSTTSPHIKIINSELKENPKMVDYRKETSEPLESEFISTEYIRCLSRNTHLRKSSVGEVSRRYSTLPSDTDTNFKYGIRSKPTESIRDIMANNFQKEWFEKRQEKEKRKQEKEKTRPRKMFTDASIMRSDFIKKIYEKSLQKDNPWKMSRFNKVGAKVSTRRTPQLVVSALNSSFNQNRYRTSQTDNLNTTVL